MSYKKDRAVIRGGNKMIEEIMLWMAVQNEEFEIEDEYEDWDPDNEEF
jgi:hypothetical protein